MVDRVEPPRRRDGPGEHRGLGQREVRRVPAEIRLRRGLDAVQPVAEVDVVEVELEDLLLRVLPLGGDRAARLPELSPERLGAPPGHVLHELLGDGRSALDVCARPEVGHGRPGDRLEVHAAVLVEAVVLDREHGPLRDVRDVVEGDDLAIFVEVDGRQDRLAVGGVHGGALREPRELDVLLALAPDRLLEALGHRAEALGGREEREGEGPAHAGDGDDGHSEPDEHRHRPAEQRSSSGGLVGRHRVRSVQDTTG